MSETTSDIFKNKPIGVALSGGGARGSYQAGVLRAIAEILKEQGLENNQAPFGSWSGLSAGSINASACAAGAHNFLAATERLVEVWKSLEPENIYLTDIKSLGSNSVRWIRDLTFGSLLKDKIAHALLDTAPLHELLKSHIDFSNIQKNIERGHLQSLVCTAYSYYNNRTVSFIQSSSIDQDSSIHWSKPRRCSQSAQIEAHHVMASCAIPLLFPAIQIKNEFFADGGFRNMSPLSPLIQLGYKKLLVIGVRGMNDFNEQNYANRPSVAKISGSILNGLFFDTTDIDAERIQHINEFVDAIRKDIVTKRSDYSKIDLYKIQPSQDVSRIANDNFKYFPKLLKFMMGGLGPQRESAELASYLLFVSQFTKQLIELGYNDVMREKQSFLQWLSRESF